MTSSALKPEPPRDEFESLVDANQGPLLRYANRLLRNRELAQDVVQEVFLRYLEKPLAYGEPRQRTSWLFRVTHNLCMDILKRESKRAQVHEKAEPPRGNPTGLEQLHAQETWRQLEAFLERLSDKQRAALLLFFQEDMTYKEISEIMDESLSNVGMLLSRGLRKLRVIIDREGIET